MLKKCLYKSICQSSHTHTHTHTLKSSYEDVKYRYYWYERVSTRQDRQHTHTQNVVLPAQQRLAYLGWFFFYDVRFLGCIGGGITLDSHPSSRNQLN